MRVVALRGAGGLEIEQRDEPQIGPDDVLVRMHAASLNYRDLMVLEGRFRIRNRDGFVPLSDGAGEVVAVGGKVSRVAVGARVMSVFYPRWHAGRPTRDAISDQPGGSRDGVLAELVIFPESGLVAVPDGLSYEEAATLPCAGVTAWASLQGHVPVAPGHRVLTLGSGGVSLFAIQFAKLAGAEVIVTTSSDQKAERLKELGADHVLNYRSDPMWYKTVKEIARGGVDHVIENGGIGSLSRSVQAVAIGGVVNLIGLLSDASDFDPSPLARALCDIRKITVGSTADALAMVRAVETNDLHPVLDRVFDLDEIADAFKYLGRQMHVGKIAISVG